jgi:protein gp37
MFREKRRYGQEATLVVRSKTTFFAPLHWEKPQLIFTCSWSDWFIDSADEWRIEAWDIIKQTPWHTYQILTKRAEKIAEHLPLDWGNGWHNVWLGVSIENQNYLERINILKTIPAQVRFISAEPLLGPIDLGNLHDIHWVITGGESGPRARNMNLEWARSIQLQCRNASTAFFHKQNGGDRKKDGAWGGRLLDGKTYNGFPILNLKFENYEKVVKR